MAQTRDPVEAFLRSNTFVCSHLGNARITPEQCAGRQQREIETKMFGRKITVNNSPQDKWCRSGCCALGLPHLRRYDYKAYLKRVKERNRKRRSFCKPLGATDSPRFAFTSAGV